MEEKEDSHPGYLSEDKMPIAYVWHDSFSTRQKYAQKPLTVKEGIWVSNTLYQTKIRRTRQIDHWTLGDKSTKQDKVYNGPRVVESISAIWK